MDHFQLIMLVSSVLLSMQLIPQVYKIYKNKSAKDISYISIIITLIGLSGIITYGIHMNFIELWVPPIVQVCLTSQTLLMKIYYDNFYKKQKMNIHEEVDTSFRSHVVIGIRYKPKGEHLEPAFKFE